MLGGFVSVALRLEKDHSALIRGHLLYAACENESESLLAYSKWFALC